MSSERSDGAGRAQGSGALRFFTYSMAFLVVALLIAIQILRLVVLATPGVSANAELTALERANDAVASVELVLSFLEGASVLIGLGFGAAALYGLRNTDELRKELETEVEKVRELREEVQREFEQAKDRDREMERRLEREIEILERFRPDLEHLKALREEMNRAQEELALVQQAHQEFQLGNFQTAYRFARQVLEMNPENWLALYIAGWLEVHQFDRLEDGIMHLRQVTELKQDWPAALAAYGVALRRKARQAEGEERERLFTMAEGALLQALGQSPSLMDFNEESYWGPVGGIRLETGRMDSAIEAYEAALRVTPDSSYPAGNLATLYLQRAHRTGNSADRERALNAFERTVQAARREQNMKPNDYYLWMDLAQAQTMLGVRNPVNFEQARQALEKALAVRPSRNMLATSLRGWHSLLDYCPDSAEWQPVRQAIQQAASQITAVLEGSA
ncbi:MAG: hypothetical protein Kow0077_31990 [Anaerolineae bacterium]